MDACITITKNGISCIVNRTRILLDPKVLGPDLNFVSHAHMDHLPSRGNGTVLASPETRRIADFRGVSLPNHASELDSISMHDSGHIYGARGLLCDGLFYTGDICTRERGFLSGADIPKCQTLITECTFGLPEFSFPPVAEIQRQANMLISTMYSKGIPVILMGYKLGKAQTLTQLFEHWEPLYLHDSIKEINDLHRMMGVDLKDAMGHTQARTLGLLSKKPWVMIAPTMSEKNPFIMEMKSLYGALTIGFSGWVKSTRFSFGRRCDYSLPLSDHCDYEELVAMVMASGAEKVYTVHGFVDEFAASLREHGIDAQPLNGNTLDQHA